MFRLITCFYFIFFHIIFSQNNYNDSLQKTGYWVGYYDSGELRYEGYFENGKETGLFKYYYKSGNLDIELFYITPGIYAEARIYYSNDGDFSAIKALGNYCDKKRCGLWEYFDDKGNILSKENYLNNLLDGDVIFYFNGTGLVMESFEYKNGKKNGKAFEFYESGAVKILTFYVDDKLEGEFSFFDRTGLLIERGFYNQGFREGEWIMYQDNKKISSTFYKNGQLIDEK